MTRYQKNILISEIGESGQQKIKNAKVLICGAGGLASGVIFNLCALGVMNIGIVDFDKVELTNLNRQYIHKTSALGEFKVLSARKTALEFNPVLNIKTYCEKIDENNVDELILPYDIIVDCLDSIKTKLLVSSAVIKTDKTLVHGGVDEFFGQVCTIDKTSACLACILPENALSDENNAKKGVISPCVSTISSIQSMEVFKVITSLGEPLKNQLLLYSGLEQSFKKIKVQKNPNCPVCSK